MIKINKNKCTFKVTLYELEAEFCTVCEKMREIMAQQCGEEYSQEMFDKMVEMSKKQMKNFKKS